MTYFVDTSVWYASVARGDANNEHAKRLLAAADSLVTTDHVLVELWNLVSSRMNQQTATDVWRGLESWARIECVHEADSYTAAQTRDHYVDQTFSLADCTSFAVMERLGLQDAASFDHHFRIYRYGPGRQSAFRVHG